MYKHDNREFDVRISEKALLTVNEAAAYTGIGICKLRQISDAPNCDFVLFVGNRRTFKRKLLEEYLLSQYSI